MSKFILDCGDEIFAKTICAALKKRGVDWSSFGDETAVQSRSKERCLVISSATDSCDINSDNFETFLRSNKITKAFVLVCGTEEFEISEKHMGPLNSLKYRSVYQIKGT